MSSSFMDINKLVKLRPLGSMEQYSSARHFLGYYNNVGISANYASCANLIDLKPIIFSAVAAVVQKHSILSAITIDEHSAHPYFARLPEINLEDVITFVTRKLPISNVTGDSELDQFLEMEHNRNFKDRYGSLPFWRLLIVLTRDKCNEFTACFIFHHSLADGNSGLVFQKDFHSALNEAAPLASLIVKSLDTPLLPPLELLHPMPIPVSNKQEKPNSLWTGHLITSLPAHRKFRSLTISSTTTKDFIGACRRHSATLTAALPVIIAGSIFESIPFNFDSLVCGIPVNIRRYLPVPAIDHEMGNFVDGFNHIYTRTDASQFNWEEVARSKQSIADYLSAEGKVLNIAKLKEVTNMRQFFEEKIGKARGNSFDVSNIGVFQTEKRDGKWEMGRVVFSRSAGVAGSAISIGVVTGMDGCLEIGFCWLGSVVESEVVGRVIEMVAAGIEEVARDQGSN